MSAKPNKKIAINQAAIELFAVKGFAGTTIKDIAAKARVTEGALYRHYTGKEAMAQELFESELANIAVTLLAAFSSVPTPRQKLRAVTETFYGLYRERPWPILFVLLNFQALKGDSVLFQQKSLFDFVIKYSQDLFTNLPRGRVRELLPTVLNGILIQPIIYHYHQKLPRHPLAYVDEVVRNCCKLLNLETV